MADPQSPRILLAPSPGEHVLIAGFLILLSATIALTSGNFLSGFLIMLSLSLFCYFLVTFFDFKTVLEDENGLIFRFGYGLFKRKIPYDSIVEVRFVMIPKSGWGMIIARKNKKKRAYPLKQNKGEIRKFVEYLHRRGIRVYWFI